MGYWQWLSALEQSESPSSIRIVITSNLISVWLVPLPFGVYWYLWEALMSWQTDDGAFIWPVVDKAAWPFADADIWKGDKSAVTSARRYFEPVRSPRRRSTFQRRQLFILSCEQREPAFWHVVQTRLTRLRYLSTNSCHFLKRSPCWRRNYARTVVCK